MTDTKTAEALRGPWLAVLSDSSGFVFPTVADAIESLGEEEEVEIAVVRGSAMPDDRNGTSGVLLRRPGSVLSGDVAHEIECYLVDPDDESVGAAVRYAQAQAMAAGLNAAGSMPALSIERPDDERIEVHVNGQEVATANHDEHGWSGMDAVEKTALAVARAFGAVVSA